MGLSNLKYFHETNWYTIDGVLLFKYNMICQTYLTKWLQTMSACWYGNKHVKGKH